MKICIIGTGYVGLVSGVCFADLGNIVHCVDIDFEKINKLNQGSIPIFEPGLEEMVKKNYKDKRLIFTTDLKKAVIYSDIIFICVGTPTIKNSNSVNLKYVFKVVKNIRKYIKKFKIIITKSTIPVATGDKIEKMINSKVKRKLFEVVSNPEFLREGEAIRDFNYPDRVVIGTDNKKSNKIFTISNTIKNELLDSIDIVSLSGYTRYLFGKNISMLCNSKIKFISWYENQPQDKNFYRGLRFNQSDVKVYGAQLFPWPSTVLNYHIHKGDQNLRLIPDCILVNGYLWDAVG